MHNNINFVIVQHFVTIVAIQCRFATARVARPASGMEVTYNRTSALIGGACAVFGARMREGYSQLAP